MELTPTEAQVLHDLLAICLDDPPTEREAEAAESMMAKLLDEHPELEY